MGSVRFGLRNPRLWLASVLVVLVAASAPRPGRAEPVSARKDETVGEAMCRLIEGAAARSSLPVAFLTRIIWQESRFRANAVSPAGAQGVAQFMPGTALERGLLDPFDPEQAIPASAALLADLSHRFGNLGLAAAAYNGGPARVTAWLAGSGSLPFETQDYVLAVTGVSADDWAARPKPDAVPPASPKEQSCLTLAKDLRVSAARVAGAELPFAPWGVQLAGNFSKSLALASYARAQHSYAAILGDVRPMVIGTRLRSRGFRAFYRIRVPADTRQAAISLCNRIHAVRGACVVLRS